MKHLMLLALFLSTTANAALVKAPSCGVGMKCVNEQTTCPIKKPVKKAKKLYKTPKATTIPVIEEKPCVNEVVQNFYTINEPYTPYNHVDRYPIDNAIRPQTESVFGGWGDNGWSGVGTGLYGGYFPFPYIIVLQGVCVECCVVEEVGTGEAPVATPLPSSIYLLMSGCLLFLRRKF